MRIEGLVFAGISSADAPAPAAFFRLDVEAATAELADRGIEPDGEPISARELRYRHLGAPHGRVFELVDRRG